MGIQKTEQLLKDVMAGKLNINSLSDSDYKAVKSLASTKISTPSAQQPSYATKAGQQDLAKKFAEVSTPTPALTPTVEEPPKAWSQSVGEWIGKKAQEYPTVAGAVGLTGAVLKKGLTSAAGGVDPFAALGLGSSMASNLTGVATDLQKPAEKTAITPFDYAKQFGQGVQEFYKTNPWYSSPGEAITSGIENINEKSRPFLDTTKNIYAQAAKKRYGLTDEQAMQSAENWVRDNPNLAGTSANLFSLTDPTLYVGASPAKIAQMIGKRFPNLTKGEAAKLAEIISLGSEKQAPKVAGQLPRPSIDVQPIESPIMGKPYERPISLPETVQSTRPSAVTQPNVFPAQPVNLAGRIPAQPPIVTQPQATAWREQVGQEARNLPLGLPEAKPVTPVKPSGYKVTKTTNAPLQVQKMYQDKMDKLAEVLRKDYPDVPISKLTAYEIDSAWSKIADRNDPKFEDAYDLAYPDKSTRNKLIDRFGSLDALMQAVQKGKKSPLTQPKSVVEPVGTPLQFKKEVFKVLGKKPTAENVAQKIEGDLGSVRPKKQPKPRTTKPKAKEKPVAPVTPASVTPEQIVADYEARVKKGEFLDPDEMKAYKEAQAKVLQNKVDRDMGVETKEAPKPEKPVNEKPAGKPQSEAPISQEVKPAKRQPFESSDQKEVKNFRDGNKDYHEEVFYDRTSGKRVVLHKFTPLEDIPEDMLTVKLKSLGSKIADLTDKAKTAKRGLSKHEQDLLSIYKNERIKLRLEREKRYDTTLPASSKPVTKPEVTQNKAPIGALDTKVNEAKNRLGRGDISQAEHDAIVSPHKPNWAAPNYVDPSSVKVVPNDVANTVSKALPVEDLKKFITDLLGVKVRTGRLITKNAWGYFIRPEHMIRVLRGNDMPTILHEIGHQTDFTYALGKNLPPQVQTELLNINPSHLAHYPNKNDHIAESIAEYFRIFFQNPDSIKQIAPMFTEVINSKVPKDLVNRLNKIAMETKKWHEQSGVERVKNLFVNEAPPDGTWLTLPESLETAGFWSNYPLAKMEAEIRSNAKRLDFQNLQYALEEAKLKLSPSDYAKFEQNIITDFITKHGDLPKTMPTVAGEKSALGNVIKKYLGVDLDGSLHRVFKGKDIGEGISSPAKAADLSTGSPALIEKFLEENLDKITNYVKQKKISLDNVIAYATGLHINDLHLLKREVKQADGSIKFVPYHTGWSEQNVIDALSLGTPEVKQAAKMLVEFNKKVLDMAVDYGLVNAKVARAWKKRYKNYVPLQRFFEESADSTGINAGTGKKFVNMVSPYAPVKGSNRSIINPLLSMADTVKEVIHKGELNKVGRALWDLAEFTGSGKHLERIRGMSANFIAGSPKSNERIITVFINGKPMQIQIGQREVYDVLTNMTDESASIVGEVFNGVNQLFRKTKTSTPSFWLKDVPLGEIHALFASHGKFYIPVYHLIKGLKLRFDPKIFDDWTKSGAGHSSITSQDTSYTADVLKKYSLEKPATGALQKTVRGVSKGAKLVRTGAKNLGKLLEIIPKYADESRSIAMFDAYLKPKKKQLDDLLAQGKITKKEYDKKLVLATTEAAWKAKDLMNFQRRGGFIRTGGKKFDFRGVVKHTPFLNPALQGRSVHYRSLVNNPSRFLTLGMLLATFSAGVYMHNRQNATPEQKKLIDQQQHWDRSSNYMIADPDGVTVHRIPKPYDVSWAFANATEDFLRHLDDKDPNAFSSYMKGNANDILPVVGNGILPLFGAAIDRDFKTGASLVPQSMQSVSPQYQYDAKTSKLSRKIGELSAIGSDGQKGLSPIILSYLGQQYGGDWGKLIAKGVDETILKNEYTENPPMAQPDFMKEFFVGRFAVKKGKYQSQNVSDFYKNFEEIKTAYTNMKREKVKSPLMSLYPSLINKGGYYKQITDMNARKRMIEKSSMPPEDKKKKLEQLFDDMDEIAKKANKKIDEIKERKGVK